jgi:uncharacterized protein (DUF697 family)
VGGKSVVIAGLPDAGKSTLYNYLQGHEVSSVGGEPEAEEDFGFFLLVDLLPEEGKESGLPSYDYPAWQFGGMGTGMGTTFEQWNPTGGVIGEGELLLFVVDGMTGLEAAAYRGIRRLQASGTPLLVVLNKIDEMSGEDYEQVTCQWARQLALPVIPISAKKGTNVYERLLPKIVSLCPDLVVPLGQQLPAFREQAAREVVHSTVLTCAMLGLEPVPLLDVPFQVALEVRMVWHLSSLYGHTASQIYRRDIVVTVAIALSVRYAAQQLVKLVPLLGWALSGLISALGAWLIGLAAIRYFDWLLSGTPLPLASHAQQVQKKMGEMKGKFGG